MKKKLSTADLVTRRRLLGTAAAGAAAVPLAACATSGTDDEQEEVTIGDDPDNPFGVDPDQPLDVVIFDGGFGEDYAIAHQEIYNDKFPNAEITHLATQAIAETQQPRFAQGDPADVIDNSGAQQIPMDSLINDGELSELSVLLDAPSYDDPNVSVRDTLRPGVLEAGTYNGNLYSLNYIYSAWTLWYDGKLFREKGWDEPQSWEEMMALCVDIKDEGIAPWTYAGQHPVYLYDMFMILAGKHGGVDVIKDIDNLEPEAWRNDSVVAAAEAMYSLYEQEFILPGTPGADHTQSQTSFNNNEAAFIPCGSWLPNEQRAIAPDDFEYVPVGVFPLEGSVQPGLISAGGEEPFIVPSKASNKAGAFEYLRMMLSQAGAQAFGDAVQAATVVEGVEVDNLAAQLTSELVANPDDLFQPQFRFWYSRMNDEVRSGLGALMSGDNNPDEFIERMQNIADETADDDSIEHFTHD
ncbi:N-acetylglucosamine/diacetylchitobiose ABC transporter substrate-binding protein [Natronoglycomyces albus]|uniref:N-acetylglucosamine/diacetylchitobiose ABC transporter substrate-binding protein n=1 Tax=Natronoglycomyces albus TaxID=2811108 RepID=A0A895XRX0_9ACTN|nr:N-acetylglucosamine/diacetylchitobiose ABC transporter substrate-binding protein [Natronoglycomyces albus]QSB04368.1 N-acetylglucosamine/diacetylchitobiose ABC transporter substrate-binding protein [Natronoglycomyces albus]